ncbi:MAG: preprotein translocase subunit SecE [Candidatus Phytoplasma vitis]|nr:MAG: preprotein translocase subunit SecE [Candidatus Phytoplasma vitis]
MVLKKNKTEELIVNPLYDIIKNEYGFKNVFFLICSIISMGLLKTLFIEKQEHFGEKMFYSFFSLSFFVFLISIYPFIKKSIKDINLIVWPLFHEIIFKIINVICFSLVLIGMFQFFNFLYSYIDPLVSKIS